MEALGYVMQGIYLTTDETTSLMLFRREGGGWLVKLTTNRLKTDECLSMPFVGNEWRDAQRMIDTFKQLEEILPGLSDKLNADLLK